MSAADLLLVYSMPAPFAISRINYAAKNATRNTVNCEASGSQTSSALLGERFSLRPAADLCAGSIAERLAALFARREATSPSFFFPAK